MIKVIPAGNGPFGDPPAALVKASARGLLGADRAAFAKRAGGGLLDAVDRLERRPGEELVHLIAIGSTEHYGPNRNGDGFKAATCRATHDTFVKHARWFHNHQNRSQPKSYGVVRLSDYNEDMHRIELVVGLNGTKEAAVRNGGLEATKELEKLARDESLAVSMACHVQNDICSICHHKARNREEYCRGTDEGGTCPGGGAYRKLATVLADGRQLYVDNPDPKFFDISWVPRPADRIAYTTGLLKAASFDKLGGAALAELYGIAEPLDLAVEPDAPLLALVRKLAAAEAAVAVRRDPLALAFVPAVRRDLDWRVAPLGPTLKAAAAARVLLPPAGLFAVAGDGPTTVPALSAVFRQLAAATPPKLAAAVAAFRPAAYTVRPAQVLMAKAAADYSVDEALVGRRVVRGSLHAADRRPPVEKAAAADAGKAFAYAAYQLAALQSFGPDDFLCQLVANQNAM